MRDIDFEVGDFVLVYVTRQRKKLRVKLTGPFKVVDTINPVVYVCENLVTGTRSSVHTSRLRKYMCCVIISDLMCVCVHMYQVS